MTIKRYIADSDTTITNAFESNLVTRGTGSNMGKSDVTEVFSIFGQASASAGYSPELSRVLYKFPTSTISSDRTAGTIPATGSVEFYLNLYNVKHAFTLPRDFTLVVSAVSQSWEEGYGLDMEGYSDLTYDGIGANWINASSGSIWGDKATATITFTGSPKAGETLTIIDTALKSVAYTAATETDTTADPPEFENLTGGVTAIAAALKSCIEAATGHNGTIIVTDNGDGSLSLEQNVAGGNGNTTMTDSGMGTGGGINTAPTLVQWAGGAGSIGGNLHDSPVYVGSFDRGYEDLSVDITGLVEEWVAGTKSNYGLAVYLTSSQEAYYLSSTGVNTSTLIHNTVGAQKSYYTKKFFARGTEFFFKRPCIEARWDSTDKDDRGNCFYSSSLAPGEDNLNTIYLYNTVRGQLQNIPAIGAGAIYVSLYSGSSDNSSASGSALQLVSDANHVSKVSNQVVTGGYISTGIYTASFALTAALSPLTRLYDIWHTAAHTAKGAAATATITFTGSPKADETLTIIDTALTSVAYTAATETDTTASPPEFENLTGGVTAIAAALKSCIDSANGHNGTISVTDNGDGSLTLTQNVKGANGNTTMTDSGMGTGGGINTAPTLVQWAGGQDSTQFHTGSISPITLDSLNIANTPRYTTKITNLKDSYADQENTRFRVYTRDRNWNPNIYKKASSKIQNLIVEDVYYKVLRVTDELDVLNYGTGSTPGATGSASDYTRISFDVSGSYFDLDMTLLESGYAYGIKFVYYVNGKYLEQPETFKFRVE